MAASSVMLTTNYAFAEDGFEGEDSLYGDDMGDDMEGYGGGK